MSHACQADRFFLLICMANMAFTLQLTHLQPATYPITGCPPVTALFAVSALLLAVAGSLFPAVLHGVALAGCWDGTEHDWARRRVWKHAAKHLVTQCDLKYKHILQRALLDTCWRTHIEAQNYGNVITMIQSKLNCVLIHFQMFSTELN